MALPPDPVSIGLKLVFRKLLKRGKPLAAFGRAVCVVILLGALTGLGFAMSASVYHVAIAAGAAGTPGVFHVQHCEMVPDPNDPRQGNDTPECTGLFQPSVPGVAPNPNATLDNGHLNPDGSTIQVSSDGSDALIPRAASSVWFYLGWVLVVLGCMAVMIFALLPPIISGWFGWLTLFPWRGKTVKTLRIALIGFVVLGFAVMILSLLLR